MTTRTEPAVYWLTDPYCPDDPEKIDTFPITKGSKSQTIRQWLDTNNGFARLKKQPAVCVMDGVELCHADYDRVIDGAVCFVTLPQGGDSGSNPLAMIAMIALTYVSGGAAMALAGTTTATAGIGTAMIQGAIMVAGGMMINALLPPPGLPGSATPSQGSPTYSLAAQGNTARLGQPIPVHYGRTICYPDFAAQAYTEYDNNEQYVNMLLCIGQGRHTISNVKLELTSIENFDEAVYEIVEPYNKVTLFHTSVVNAPEAGGQDLSKPLSHGPYIINAIDQEITRIALDINFPGGLIGSDEDSGDEYGVGVHIRCIVEPIDDNDKVTGPAIVVHDETISGQTRTAIRRSIYKDLPAGRYQATVSRTTEEAPRNEVKSCQLSGIRGFIADDNEYGDLTLMAVRIRASENNVSTQVNCVAQRLLPVWSPTTGWSDAVATRSPAWAFADMVRARYGGDFADSELNLPELHWLAGELGKRDDTFDGRFDTENNLWSAMEQIGQVCRSRPVRMGLMLRLLRDFKQENPVAVFSGANITDFSVDYVQASEAGSDSVLASYLDEDKGYQQRTVLCQLAGTTADKPTDINLFGAVNRDQAYREGMYLVKTNRTRRQMVSFKTGREGKIPKWGDLIHISHPKLGSSKKFAGLIVAANGQNLTLSQEVSLPDRSLLVLRNSSGLPSTPLTVVQTGENTVRVSDPLPFIPVTDPNQERTHFIVGEAGETIYPVKVLGIEPANEADVVVSGVLEDDTVHDDDGSSPALPPDYGMPPMAPGVISDLQATQGGTINQPVIYLSWSPAPRSDKYLIELSTDTRQTWQPAGTGISLITQHSFTVAPGEISVRVAGIGAMKGEWVYLNLNAGSSFAKPEPLTIRLASPFTGDALQVEWDAEPAAARYRVEVWSGGKLRRFVDLAHTITEYSYHYLDAIQDGAGRTLTIKAKAVNAQQVEGEWADVTATNAPPAVPTGVEVSGLLDSLLVECDSNDSDDLKELRVYGSQSQGFAPTGDTLMAAGTSEVMSVPVPVNTTWFVRLAWVDHWGSDSLNYSTEFKSTAELISETEITDDSISTPKLKANAVTADKIKAGSITTEKLDAKSVNSEKLTADVADFVVANIEDGSINNAMIGNEIKSDGYTPDNIGWRIDKSGNAEFSDIKARGLIEGSIIRGSVIEGGMLIQSDIQITTPTEADRGAGTVRYLSVVTSREQVGSWSGNATTAVTTLLDICSASYSGEGYENYGEGKQKEPVYVGLNRYLKYTVKPYAEAETNAATGTTTIQIVGRLVSGGETILWSQKPYLTQESGTGNTYSGNKKPTPSNSYRIVNYSWGSIEIVTTWSVRQTGAGSVPQWTEYYSDSSRTFTIHKASFNNSNVYVKGIFLRVTSGGTRNLELSDILTNYL